MANSRTTSPEPSPTISIAIATASTAALWREYDAHSLAETYQQRAKELGYVYLGGKVHGALLAHDLLNFYGADFLRRYGCLKGSGPRLLWPGKLLQPAAQTSTTFKHILLKVFLDSHPTPSTNRIDFEGRRRPKPRDWPQIEREAIECFTAEVSRHRQAGTRVNLEDLYDVAGIHSIVKTKKHQIPALMAWIEQFKKSPQSTRIPGRRPRR
nr:TnsD family Tn7-like transposition protein [uncultured Rhodoferax sp.]